MQDKQKDNFSEEENDYSRETKAPQTIMTAFDDLDRNRKIVVIFLVFFSLSFFIYWIISTKNTITNQLNPSFGSEDETQEINYELFGNENTEGIDYEDIDRDLSETSNEICPPGQDCRLYNAYEESSESGIDIFLNEDINIGTPDPTGIDEETLYNILDGEVDVKKLRDMLLNAGMDKGILDTISDEDLMQSYQEILQ